MFLWTGERNFPHGRAWQLFFTEANDQRNKGHTKDGDLLQAYTIRASRQHFRRFKEVAAYNVAQHLNLDNDADFQQIPYSLRKQFVLTLSGHAILYLNKNWNTVDSDFVKKKVAPPVVSLQSFFFFIFLLLFSIAKPSPISRASWTLRNFTPP